MRRNLPLLAVCGVFVAMILLTRETAPVYVWLFPGAEPPVYDRGSFLALAASHLGLALAALAASAVLGITSAILVTRQAGHAFRSIVQSIATIGQTFPPAAVLALMVPILGFGARPTLLALVLYGLLPIIENTLAGIESVPPAVRDAAVGMGLSPGQVLRQVELPLALPLILAGLRTALVIGLGTATIGSTVGTLTLGTPIIDGLVSNKPNFIFQGAIPLALLAMLVELAFDRIEQGKRAVYQSMTGSG
jgi:osmoprotectant transport system permease protein